MRRFIDRQICHICNVILPRASRRRCPHCLASTQLADVVSPVICQTCDRTVPRAHAGQCPYCAVARVGYVQ